MRVGGRTVGRRDALWYAAAAGLGAPVAVVPSQQLHFATLEARITPAIAELRTTLAAEEALAGTLLRLAFHDSVTRDGGEGGANGSVRYELTWRENRHLGIALQALEPIQARHGCSLADLIACGGALAVSSAGGPSISLRELGLGRHDSTSADPRQLRSPVGTRGCPPSPKECRGRVDSTLPSTGLDTDGLRRFFSRLGFSVEEAVALCGAHTLGRHASLIGVSKTCLRENPLSDACIESGTRLPFVGGDADAFSNSYFKALLAWEERTLQPGDANFIPTDVVLTLSPQLREVVRSFAQDESRFFAAFRRAYLRLVRIGFTPLGREEPG